MVQIVAEAGINHNGSLSLALEMVEAAAEAGADYIKFQTYNTAELLQSNAPKAAYQLLGSGGKSSQSELLENCRLSEDNFLTLKQRCSAKQIGFSSTAFDVQSLNFLVKQAAIDFIKIPSGEITNAELLYESAVKRIPIFISTGMAYEEEIEKALGIIAAGLCSAGSIEDDQKLFSRAHKMPQGREVIQQYVTVLYCVSEYPASIKNTNLMGMVRLRDRFNSSVGFSDHSTSLNAPVVATALGAEVIEKHFTLSRKMEGPDQPASVEPDELKQMVNMIREAKDLLGDREKHVTDIEKETRKTARRSLVAKKRIRKGDKYSRSNLGAKRPGTGKSAIEFWDLIGKKAAREYRPDEMIDIDE